jgi:hypothetical protein
LARRDAQILVLGGNGEDACSGADDGRGDNAALAMVFLGLASGRLVLAYHAASRMVGETAPMRYVKASAWFAVECVMLRVSWWYCGHTEDPLGAIMALVIAGFAAFQGIRVLRRR